jgi:dipeptidase E
MIVILYSNEVISEKLHVDSYLYHGNDEVKIAFIPLIVEEEIKKKHYKIVQRYYSARGINHIRYFDLLVKNATKFRDVLAQYDVFHFSGGNTLETLNYYRQAGWERFFSSLAQGEKLFIGHCGGAVLLSSNVSWIRLRIEDIGTVLDDFATYRGLELVNFEFIPHYNRFQKDKNFLKKLVEYSIGINHSIYLCRDGDGLIVENGALKFKGALREIAHGEIY